MMKALGMSCRPASKKVVALSHKPVPSSEGWYGIAPLYLCPGSSAVTPVTDGGDTKNLESALLLLYKQRVAAAPAQDTHVPGYGMRPALHTGSGEADPLDKEHTAATITKHESGGGAIGTVEAMPS